MTGHESWIDRQIREAQERGEFDNLPGAGKPIEGLGDRRPDDWWARRLIEREQLDVPLPTSLALRKEVANLAATLADERSEETVRELVADLNRRVLEARRLPVSGPPLFVRTVDVEETVQQWQQERSEREQGRRAAVDEMWSRRRRRKR